MLRPSAWMALALGAAWLVAGPTVGPAVADDEPPITAGDCTLRGRSLDRSLDELLSPGPSVGSEPRMVVFVIDASPALKSAGFERAFRGAVERAGRKLATTRLAVLAARDGARPVVCEAGEADAAVAAVDDMLSSSRSQFADVYDATRRGVKVLRSAKGVRELVLVSLENGDVESDLEAAVKTCLKADARVSVLTWQSFLSDTYWTYRASEAPRGLTPRGGEAAFVELPWGWVFQNAVANEHTGSGFAAFGLSRLAASTGGCVYLFDDGRTSEHKCEVVGSTCTFCTSDHLPEGTAYQTGMLNGMAPVAAERSDALAAAARDPFFAATLAAWEAATDAGLVRSSPSVKRSGASLKSSGSKSSRMAEVGSTLGFEREARNATELADTCGALAGDLRADIDDVPAGEGSPRMRANAETTYLLLRVTRVNLLGFAAWCRDVGPELLRHGVDALPFPEYPALSEGFRPTGISHTGFSLCHGVEPFLRQRWPGGDEFRAELESLAAVHDRLLAKYAHSPYGMAIRRSTLARFQLSGVGKYVPPPDRERPDSESEDPTTGGPDRTPRGGGSGSGGSTPTTGDK